MLEWMCKMKRGLQKGRTTMADYVRNRLTIKGNHEEIQSFLANAKGEDFDFDFEKIIPIPEDLIPSNEYRWMLKNWGANNTDENVFITDSQDGAIIVFDTEDCPPIPIYQAIKDQHPSFSVLA